MGRRRRRRRRRRRKRKRRRRRRRRRKPLLDDLKEKRRYCKLKEEALDRTVWRTCSGRGCGPVARQSKD
jgi:hypothetical protein